VTQCPRPTTHRRAKEGRELRIAVLSDFEDCAARAR
jgi:hypothetical protein